MSVARQIRVLLVDDHTLFRKGLAELLEQRGEITVAGIAGNGVEAKQLLQSSEPDVVITDLNMPPHGGLALLREIRADGWRGPVLVLTVSDDEDDLASAMSAGAQGYLLKDMEPAELVNALRDIQSGRTVVAPELAGVLARVVQGESVEPERQETPFSDLTPRELEILCLLAEGQSNKVIARNLGISDGTVKLHVKAVLRKLNVHSRVEAAVMAVEQNLCQKELG